MSFLEINFSKNQWAVILINLVLFLSGLFLLAAGLLIWLVFFPRIVRQNIEKDKIVHMNPDESLNKFTDEWLNNKYTTKLHYWFYNYSNTWEIVDHGTNPDIFEKGPYTYIENITYHYNENSFSIDGYDFTYYKTTDYIFDPSSSCSECTEDDEFMLPDMAFFGLADKMLDRDEICKMLRESNFTALPGHCNNTYQPQAVNELRQFFSTFVSLYDGGPFINLRVKEILWTGYEDPIFTRMMVELKKDMPNLYNLMQNQTSQNLTITPLVRLKKNNTISLNYTINTGENAWSMVGKMELYNGSNELPKNWWSDYDKNSIYCSPEKAVLAGQLSGTNGDFFQPQIKTSTVLNAFQEDICRTLNFLYKSTSKVRGIDTYRFVIDSKSFQNSDPENCGYCRKLPRDMYGRKEGSFCLPDGLLDISGCQPDNTPIAISSPHFSGADVLVQLMYPRLKLNETDDQTFLDIEPNTGTILKAQKLLQINFIAKNYPESAFSNIPSGVYPMVWVNESYMLDDKTYNNLKHDLINPRNVVRLLCVIVGIGLGSTLLILSLASSIINISYFTKRKSAQINQNNVSTIRDELHPPPVHTVNSIDDMQIQQRIRPRNSTLER